MCGAGIAISMLSTVYKSNKIFVMKVSFANCWLINVNLYMLANTWCSLDVSRGKTEVFYYLTTFIHNVLVNILFFNQLYGNSS